MKTTALLILLISCSQLPSPVAVNRNTETENSTFKIIRPRLCIAEAGFSEYASVLEPLVKDGYRIVKSRDRFTPAVLKDCEIQLLSGSSSLTTAEIDLLYNWVGEGGSLLIMAGAEASLRERFGIRESVGKVQGVQLNPVSPIVQGRSEGERLKSAPTTAGKVLQGPKDSDLFYRMSGSETEASALALKSGRGRVVAFGDEAAFTSKQDLELALNVFHWLSHVL